MFPDHFTTVAICLTCVSVFALITWNNNNLKP